MYSQLCDRANSYETGTRLCCCTTCLDIWSSDEAWFTNTLPLLESLITEVIKQSTARNINKLASQVRGLSRSGMPFSFYPAGKIADFILRSLGKTFISFDYVFLWGDAITVLNERQHLIKKLIEVVVVVILIGLLVGIVAGLIANYITLYILHWH